MVFERSVNSKVFHRRGCGFLKSVRPENMTAFDLEFGERNGLNPCKCCCSLKHIARRWSHFNTYKDIKLVEIGDDFLMIAAPKRK